MLPPVDPSAVQNYQPQDQPHLEPCPAMTNPAAEAARAWPFEEARKLVKRLEKRDNTKGYALFETGYGPSGLAAYRHLRRGGADVHGAPGVPGTL